MFGIIFCFSPLILLCYHLYLIKKRTSLSWGIKKGEICYHCKESLNLSNDIMVKRLLDPKDYSSLCVSCNRDRKIQQIKRPYTKWKFNFLNFLISDKFSKLNIIFIVSIALFIVGDVVLNFTGSKIRLWSIYGTMNFILYFVTIYRTIYTTQKK